MIWQSLKITTRVFCFFLLFCAILATILIVFASQLDLDNYRQSLEQELSAALAQPVRIGHSSLTFNRGLAIEFRQLELGPAEAPLAIIPRITATLEIPPLFEKKISLKQVQLDNPELNLTLPLPVQENRNSSHQLINSLGIDSLSVRNARLKVFYLRDGKSIKRAEISGIHSVLRGWQPGKTGQLIATGHIDQTGADFVLETSLPSSADPAVWRQETLTTKLQLSHFSTRHLPKIPNQQYPAAVDLKLDISGTPAQGTRILAEIKDSATVEKFFTMSGLWTASSQRDSITNLQGKLLELPVAGKIEMVRAAGKTHLSGTLGAKDIRLDRKLLARWRIPNAQKLTSGHLDQLSVSLDKTWQTGQKQRSLPRIDTRIVLSQLQWDIPQLKQFQNFSITTRLENQQLKISQGNFVVGDHPFSFSGSIKHPFLEPAADLKIVTTPDLGQLQQQLPLPTDWTMQGTTELSLNLTGALSSLNFQLRAKLADAGFHFADFFRKKPAQPASLDISGQLSPERIDIAQAVLNLPNNQLSGSGYLLLNQNRTNYGFSISTLNLTTLKPLSPLLQNLQANGRISMDLTVQGQDLDGHITLQDFGAHLTRIIGELRKTTGTVALNRNGLSFTQLSANLGESRFLVDGKLSNWQDPQLSLDVSAAKVRSHDLIFPNRTMELHDLRGHLQIDRHGIRFAPVTVEIKDTTKARVVGAVTDFSDPQVALDISGERVDVLDIIELFHGPHEEPGEHHLNKPIKIKVAAKEGTIGGLHFQNASGVITDEKGLFVLAPLYFHNGDGWCRARVEFNSNDDQAPLKVSGHAEGVSASILHQDLFSKPGLIKGKLDGDFFVQGDPAGDDFWNTAVGGLHIQVHDGTLHKFNSLSKVFSLLNISQLFAGKLPDMAKEGMPFDLLEGSIKIADGRMTTEDLRIHSEAMNLSLVGSQGLVEDYLDFTLGVMPLRTVDKVITSIPVAGWVLTGEDKALLTAYFKIEGSNEDPKVSVIPVDSISNTVLGIFKRTLGLPGKLVKDIGDLFKSAPEKKTEP